jgi:hypothetical protein
MLPPGPVVPPLNHAGPDGVLSSHWPLAASPLLAQPNTNVWAQFHAACAPSAHHNEPTVWQAETPTVRTGVSDPDQNALDVCSLPWTGRGDRI